MAVVPDARNDPTQVQEIARRFSEGGFEDATAAIKAWVDSQAATITPELVAELAFWLGYYRNWLDHQPQAHVRGPFRPARW